MYSVVVLTVSKILTFETLDLTKHLNVTQYNFCNCVIRWQISKCATIANCVFAIALTVSETSTFKCLTLKSKLRSWSSNFQNCIIFCRLQCINFCVNVCCREALKVHISHYNLNSCPASPASCNGLQKLYATRP